MSDRVGPVSLRHKTAALALHVGDLVAQAIAVLSINRAQKQSYIRSSIVCRAVLATGAGCAPIREGAVMVVISIKSQEIKSKSLA